MSEKTFEAEFHRRIADIKTRAKAAGTSLKALCVATGMSRSTPDRWVQRAPKTVTLVDEMEAALAEIERNNAN